MAACVCHLRRIGKASGIKIFLNGNPQPQVVEKDTLDPDASIVAETPLRLGRRSDGAPFTGAVQDMRVYRRALYPREVKALANLPAIHQALAKRKNRPQTLPMRIPKRKRKPKRRPAVRFSIITSSRSIPNSLPYRAR